MSLAHAIAALPAAFLFAWATPARAESVLVLPFPPRFEEIAATTYDEGGSEALGGGFIRFERGLDGNVRMEAAAGIDGGASTRVMAELAPLSDDSGLRLLRQESRSIDVSGEPMGTLEIDHVAGEGRCTGPSRQGEPVETETLALPDDDRVVNVPLGLLFQSIVRGEDETLRFQILVCRGGPRFVSAIARRAASQARRADGARLVRVEYELSLPERVAPLVARWLPRPSFWFDPSAFDPSGSDPSRSDPSADGAWIGHETPLYALGPKVLMMRRGFAPALLGALP